MDFLIKNTKGLTLKTKGKYCTEDLVIEIDPSLVEGYMEVDELPEVGLPRVLYKVMLEEPEYYIWENDEWVKISGSDPNLQEKEITENGEYVADEGYDGFSKVTVNVESSGSDPNLQEKEITENGEYVADEGYDGFSKVTVNVESGGGEDMLQARIDATKSCSFLFYYYEGDNVDFIKNLDTSEVISTANMFGYCYYLIETPPLNTSKVQYMNNMHSRCEKLKTISPLDMIKVTSSSGMFYNCKALTNLTLLNIKVNLQISDGSSWGHLLTLESLINTVKELINIGKARTLTMGSANLSKIASTYVKFTDTSQTTIPTNEKGDVVVCESTDTGAMLLSDYALLKNWTLA